MRTKEEFDTVYDIVKDLLEKDERCRNDDKWLTFRVMQQYTKIFIPFDDFIMLPAFNTVTRTRQVIQNVERLFPPTELAVLKRRMRKREVEDWLEENNEPKGESNTSATDGILNKAKNEILKNK